MTLKGYVYQLLEVSLSIIQIGTYYNCTIEKNKIKKKKIRSRLESWHEAKS